MFWLRRFPRLRKDVQIVYRVVKQEAFANDPVRPFALNISGGGIGFETTDYLQKGVFIALELRSGRLGPAGAFVLIQSMT